MFAFPRSERNMSAPSVRAIMEPAPTSKKTEDKTKKEGTKDERKTKRINDKKANNDAKQAPKAADAKDASAPAKKKQVWQASMLRVPDERRERASVEKEVYIEKHKEQEEKKVFSM